MAEKLITKSFERLLDKGKHRGFITYEELGKSLGKRNGTNENIERAFLIIVDEKITLVEKKSQFQSNKKKETSNTSEEKSTDKSDDPIRMYLREMGGVELLSREGEIAIAKRIEAGKNVMSKALFQSPLTAKKVFEWKDKLEKNEMLVREVQKSKAFAPMLVTPLGMVMLVREVHRRKVLLSMLVMLSGMVMLFREEHRLKALSPMLLTLLGIEMLTRAVQLEKVAFPILVTLLGIAILVRAVQFAKTPPSIVVIPFGIIMLVRLVQLSKQA